MNELMKRYEAETGKSAMDELYSGSIKIYMPANDYIEWLEDQLVWRPTSEKPEKDGEYFVKFHYKDGEEGMDVCDFTNGEWFWNDIISWLPIPPVLEGEPK